MGERLLLWQGVCWCTAVLGWGGQEPSWHSTSSGWTYRYSAVQVRYKLLSPPGPLRAQPGHPAHGGGPQEAAVLDGPEAGAVLLYSKVPQVGVGKEESSL